MMSYSNAHTLKHLKNEEDEQGRTYMYNDMSAVVYQVITPNSGIRSNKDKQI